MKESKLITFSLPFSGVWLAFWGGDTAKLNHHHDTQSQKYAFDFIVVNEKGGFFKTDGSSNEDYFSFGLDILSPADGEVIEVVSGLRDNKPKELNSFNYIGNYIMIKHDKTTFSVLGHLKKDSIVVKVGQKVQVGDKLAECGNSGYTTDPHLHFHVQDSDVFARVDNNYKRVDVAKGKKIYFSKLKVGEGAKENYSPVKGDKVSSMDNLISLIPA
jgi:hypothetical protein